MNGSAFDMVLAANAATTVSTADFLTSLFTSLLTGIILAMAYGYKSRTTKSFSVTLAMLPAVVSVVIMMVNGNIGTGVAVAGAFSLVRFRSVPGTAKEICAIFIAMAIGLAAGMGHIVFAFMFMLIMVFATLVLERTSFGENNNAALHKTIRITIPEDLDYSGVFDDLFNEYTSGYKLMEVRTTNMGSLFKLTYNLTLKDPMREKEFIDALRVRNGNLEISCSIQQTSITEL